MRLVILKLAKEAQIIFIVEPNIVNAILQHGDTLDAQTEGKSAVLIRVIANLLEDLGIYHSGSKYFKPAGMLADTASLPAAHHTGDIDLRTGFGERKETGSCPDGGFFIKHPGDKNAQNAIACSKKGSRP